MEAIKMAHIVLVNDPIEEANADFAKQNPQNTRLFCANELDIDTARAIIDESYIASEGTKCILIAAFVFNVYAQNALLKVLEEPPSGIVFVVYAKMKSLLLPTVRSRLVIVNRIAQQRLPHFPVPMETLNLEGIYRFLKEREREFNSLSLKEEIQSLYLDAIRYGLDFSLRETMFFEKAMFWGYESTSNVFATLLLLVLQKKKQQLNASLRHKG